jgi:predicted butyrate kinase (DUF1464 family)
MSLRVAGADPGTSSLDWLILEDGVVRDQCRFRPDELRAQPDLPVRWLEERGPFALVAGPSGYGLPLRRAADCSDGDLALMTLMRPDDVGGGVDLPKLHAVLRALCSSPLPIVFLPGVIHMPTVPEHRKLNCIDLGTPDKLCVAALALERHAARGGDRAGFNACVVELGTAFTACLVLQRGQVVDGRGGTSGPFGWRSGGAWDGEAAYLLGPLAKRDLFAGGIASHEDAVSARARFRESLLGTVAGLHAVAPFAQVILSGRLCDTEPALADAVSGDLARIAPVTRLESLPGAWVKQAAQGAALLADGLAGGGHAALVAQLSLRGSQGTVFDWLRYPRAADVRSRWLPAGLTSGPPLNRIDDA